MLNAAETFGVRDRKFSDNIWNYYLHCRENDVAMTHTLINPQVDRSKPVEQQDKDLAAKIVKETDAGIVIRGARMVSTLAAYSHDLVVLPSTYIATSKEAGQLEPLRRIADPRRPGVEVVDAVEARLVARRG